MSTFLLAVTRSCSGWVSQHSYCELVFCSPYKVWAWIMEIDSVFLGIKLKEKAKDEKHFTSEKGLGSSVGSSFLTYWCWSETVPWVVFWETRQKQRHHILSSASGPILQDASQHSLAILTHNSPSITSTDCRVPTKPRHPFQIAHFFVSVQILQTPTDVWARGSKFKVHCCYEVLCTNCMYTACNSVYFVRQSTRSGMQ